MDREGWLRISELFDRAIEMPASDREHFVRETTGDDPELRDTVLRMLRHDSAELILDKSVDALAVSLLDETAESILAAGTRIGDYEIVDLLGRGGMGIVYRARDTRLDRLAALKFLPITTLESGGAARVEAEARAASALDHPNIATIYHVGTSSDGRSYLAMAYYEGQTLAERLGSGALPPEEAVRIALAVVSGLAAAHRRGIVHRDVKPANILLTDAGQVKLLDFGIAAAAGSTSHVSTHGTPLYMSPEQGRSTTPHPQSDVWSLGAVLYEMLAGRAPFEGDSPAALRALKAGDLPPLPEMPGLTSELRAVVGRALSREPELRYADAGEMQASLERVAAAIVHPVVTRRRRILTLLRSGVAAGILVVFALGMRWLAGNRGARAAAPSPAVLAVFPFRVSGDSEYVYLQEGMVDLLSAAFDGVGGLRSVDARAIRTGVGDADSIVLDRRRAAAVASTLGAGRFIMGEVTGRRGQLRAHATLYAADNSVERTADAEVSGEDRIFDLVDQLTGRLLGQQVATSGANIRLLASSTTPSLAALKAFLDGERALRSGGFELASASFSRAVAIDTNFSLAYYGLATAEWWAERAERARIPAARALHGAARLPRSTRMLLDGLVARLDGDFDRAEALYRQLITLAPDEPDAWFGLADVLFHYNALRGRSPQEAAPFFEHAMVLQPDNMLVRLHLANIAARRRDYARHDSLLSSLSRSVEFSRFVRIVRVFAESDSAAQASVTREFAGVNSKRLGEALHYIVRLAHNPKGGLRFVELLQDPARSDSDHAIGLLYRAGLELTLGRWKNARGTLLAADAQGSASALPLLALWSLAPFVPADSTQWRALHHRLGARRADGQGAREAQYLQALLAVRLGDTAAARQGADRLDRMPNDSAGPDGHRLALAIRAEIARGAGRGAEALALLEQIRPSPTMDLLQDPVLSQGYERFLRAELLRAAGRNDEALAWYEGQIDGATLESIYMAPAYLRSAQLLAAAGDSASSAAADRWLRDIWSDADPEVRAWARKK